MKFVSGLCNKNITNWQRHWVLLYEPNITRYPLKIHGLQFQIPVEMNKLKFSSGHPGTTEVWKMRNTCWCKMSSDFISADVLSGVVTDSLWANHDAHLRHHFPFTAKYETLIEDLVMEFCLYEQNSVVYYSEIPEIAKKKKKAYEEGSGSLKPRY